MYVEGLTASGRQLEAGHWFLVPLGCSFQLFDEVVLVHHGCHSLTSFQFHNGYLLQAEPRSSIVTLAYWSTFLGSRIEWRWFSSTDLSSISLGTEMQGDSWRLLMEGLFVTETCGIILLIYLWTSALWSGRWKPWCISWKSYGTSTMQPNIRLALDINYKLVLFGRH